jgi:hypothetical protein
VIGPLRREVETLVRAWLLTEGDQALSGETVLALYRDARRHTVTVAWDSGQRAEVTGDCWVALARRALDADPRVTALRRWYDSLPAPDPPMTPRSRFDARRRLDDGCGERRSP